METGKPPKGLPPPPTTSNLSQDLSRMPDTPSKSNRHRRAHSEIISLPDDINFDDDDLFSMYIDIDKVNDNDLESSGDTSRHRHSLSMDGSSSMNVKPEGDGVSGFEAKKAMSAAKLAELALVDPKRAKRIWANRQSAARSKERKMRYIAELERKLQTLQTEATTLSAQLTLMQRGTNGLTAENSELKIRLQTMEQQVHLQDSLNDALKEEIRHLKRLTGQSMSNGGSTMNFPTPYGTNQPFYPNNQALHTQLTANQFQQLQIRSQKQHQFQHHQLHQLQQQVQNHDLTDYITRPSMPPSDSKSSSSKD